MENKFFNFIKPFLNFIDRGELYRRPFNVIYIIFAILNLLFPLFMFYTAVDNRVFNLPVKYVFAFIFIFISICASCWLGFQIWWNRKETLKELIVEGDEFVAIPTLTYFLQTIGEWMGTWIGVTGCLMTIISLIFLGEDAEQFFGMLGIPRFVASGLMILVMPIIGFFIIVLFRLLSEFTRALASIANNTKVSKEKKSAE